MATKTKKPDCYKCKHRGEVAGSAHSSCKHPKCKVDLPPLMGLMSAMAGGATPSLKTGLKVKGNPQGIAGGWFSHPLNFDPVWLEECDGFEKK